MEEALIRKMKCFECLECLCPYFRSSRLPESDDETDDIQPGAGNARPVLISLRKVFMRRLFYKTWDVRRKRPRRRVKGNYNKMTWTCWNLSTPEEPFVYAFGLPELPNSKTFFFATAGGRNDSSIVLTEPQLASFDVKNADPRLFRLKRSGRAGVRILQHVASNKYVKINWRNRLVLTLEEELGSQSSLHFQSQ